MKPLSRVALGLALAAAVTVAWFVGFVEIADRILEGDPAAVAIVLIATTFAVAGATFYAVVRHTLASIAVGLVLPVVLWAASIVLFFSFAEPAGY